VVKEVRNLEGSWIQDIFSHILNVTMTRKGHGDIKLIVNQFKAFGNARFTHCS